MEAVVDPNNKTICSYLWSSMCVRNSGRLIPCCMYDDMEPAVNIQDFGGDVVAAYNSPFYKDMRTKALNGEENKGCRGCYFREKETGRSLRLRANDDMQEHFDSEVSPLSNVTNLEIFIGNLCNLKCLMCSPDLSISLAADYVKLGWSGESVTKLVENDYRALLPQFNNLQRLKFVGGEPLINRTHWELLESIPLERAKNINLEYATNCTIFPDESQLKLWDKFAGLEIFLSLDGVGPVNEYIRYPSRWNIIEKNAKKFRELTSSSAKHVFGINSVVSNYNIFELEQFTDWVDKNLGSLTDKYGLTTFFLSCLVYPDYLNIKNIPVEIKNELLRKYPENPHYSFVRAVLKSDGEPAEIEEFKDKVRTFDNLRKINYMNFIPSMKRLTDIKL